MCMWMYSCKGLFGCVSSSSCVVWCVSASVCARACLWLHLDVHIRIPSHRNAKARTFAVAVTLAARNDAYGFAEFTSAALWKIACMRTEAVSKKQAKN